MLSATDLEAMREAVAEALPDLGTLLRPTEGTNAIYEATAAWGTVGTAVPCRVRPSALRPELRAIAEQQQVVADWQLTFRFDQDVRAGDRLQVGEAIYEIIQGWRAASWNLALRCDARKVG